MTPFHSFHMRRMIPVLLLLPLMAIITACDHKDLCYHHKHMVKLRLEFDWSDCEDPERPDGMCVFFYPEQPGLETRRFDFTGLQGGEITIAAGRYRLLTYNNDTESVFFRGMESHSTHEVYTRSGGLFESVTRGNQSNKGIPRAEGTEDEDVVICPDMMWGCSGNRHHDFRTGNQLHLRSRKGQRRVDGASAHRHRKHHHSLSS